MAKTAVLECVPVRSVSGQRVILLMLKDRPTQEWLVFNTETLPLLLDVCVLVSNTAASRAFWGRRSPMACLSVKTYCLGSLERDTNRYKSQPGQSKQLRAAEDSGISSTGQRRPLLQASASRPPLRSQCVLATDPSVQAVDRPLFNNAVEDHVGLLEGVGVPCLGAVHPRRRRRVFQDQNGRLRPQMHRKRANGGPGLAADSAEDITRSVLRARPGRRAANLCGQRPNRQPAG